MNFVKAGIIYIFGSFCAQGLRFITLPIFSRLMSPEDYGYISSYEMWISIITVFIGLQTSATIANAYIDFGHEKIEKYTSSVSIVGSISVAIILAIVVLLHNILANLFELPFYILILGVVQCYFAYMILMVCGKYRILEKPLSYVLFSISNAIISICMAIFIINSFNNIDQYIGYIVGMIISNIVVGLFAMSDIYAKGRCFFNLIMVKYAVKLSTPLILHNLSSILLSRMNQIVLLKFVNASSAGLYSFGNNFAFIVNALYTAFNQAYIPWYYKQLSLNNIEKVKKMSEKYIKIFTMIVACLIMVIPEIIKIMSTTEYFDVIYIVPIVLFSMYINFLYTFSVNFELYNKKTQYVAFGTMIATAFNIIANILLISLYGIYGAAISTMLSTGLLFALHYYIANKKIGRFELNICIFIKNIIKVSVYIVLYYLFIENFIVRWGITCCTGAYLIVNMYTFIKEINGQVE